MQERGPLIVGALIALLLLFPLGYVFHISPRFPGSLAGSIVGIIAAVLLLVPLAYSVIKRVPSLKARVTQRVSMSTLLAVHIYAGIMGPILGLLHSAHRYNSAIGVALVGTMLLVVVSGYVGRYFLARLGKAVRARSGELAVLQGALASGGMPVRVAGTSRHNAFVRFLFKSEERELILSRNDVALALADTEYAIRYEKALRRVLDGWLAFHTATSVVLYVLLSLHIWAGLYFGLRWL
jgi:hypothetical protein